MQVIERMTLESNDKVVNYDGSVIPW